MNNNENKCFRMLIIITILILLVCLVVINAKPKYIKIDSNEAREIIVNEGEFEIIDVRSKDDYKKGHIKDSLCIPKETLLCNVEELITDKNTIIIICGKDDDESKEAAKELLNLGYRYVYDLGSIKNWTYNIEK